jgi:dipeptidyl aminopeptidase/acylaminoacyl peptidase
MIRQVTLEDLVAFPFAGVSDASLSCDGRTVLYVVNGTIRRLDAENGLESEVGAGFRPRHSPVDPARWSCQCRSREGICVRVEGADDRWIGADIRGIRRTVWSPDGQSIAILADAVPQAAAGAAASGVPTVRRLGDSHRAERSRLAVLDSESGECRLNLESEPGVSFAEMTWHPASRLLTVLAWVHEPGWGLRWQLLDVELAGGGAPAPRR